MGTSTDQFVRSAAAPLAPRPTYWCRGSTNEHLAPKTLWQSCGSLISAILLPTTIKAGLSCSRGSESSPSPMIQPNTSVDLTSSHFPHNLLQSTYTVEATCVQGTTTITITSSNFGECYFTGLRQSASVQQPRLCASFQRL